MCNIYVSSSLTSQDTGNEDGTGFLTPDYFGSGFGYFRGMSQRLEKDDIWNKIYLFISGSESSSISGYPGCKVHESIIVFDLAKLESGKNEGNGRIIVTRINECPDNCDIFSEGRCKKCTDGYIEQEGQYAIPPSQSNEFTLSSGLTK